MTILTASIVGLFAVLMAVWMKGSGSEYGTCLVMAAGVLLFFFGTGKLGQILDMVKQIEASIGINQVYLAALLKLAGITYIAEFASGICKDAGYASMGTQIEIFAKLSILAVSMPVVLALMETLKGFLA